MICKLTGCDNHNAFNFSKSSREREKSVEMPEKWAFSLYGSITYITAKKKWQQKTQFHNVV
jgi:hypothetical protein